MRSLLARTIPGLPLWASEPCLLQTGSGYAPFIETFRQHLQPGSDGFITEQYAAELEAILDTWRESLCSSPRDLRAISVLLPQTLDASELGKPAIITQRAKPPLVCEKVTFPSTQAFTRDSFLATLTAYLAPIDRMEGVDLQIYGIEIIAAAPLQLSTDVHYDLVGTLDADRREERTGAWNLIWQKNSQGQWLILNWSASSESRSRLTGPGFVDITSSCLGENISYRRQLLPGVDHWRSVLDGACGIDIYGNNGVAIGDFDGDGFDDLYVCQPAGLPNRLYRNRGNGTFEDVTEKTGLGILDGTSSAIFADLNNNGHQDLIVVRTSGPLLFINRGDGVFDLRPDVFHFARPPAGAFTGIAVADYNRDSFLDIYFCTYSFYQGLSEYQFPSPYYDARNGPPNFLLKNRGNYTFEDVTVLSGLDKSNDRFTFTCSWNDYNQDGWPDLYVVNDFGRKVLYRNNGDGTFTDVSAEAGVEDPGEGMSMTWLDYDNDGFDDLYVVNMWEPAGLRVMTQEQFLPSAPEQVRRIYKQDAMGNTLLHNEGGKGAFRDVADESGTRLGGWNWGSDAWDLDHDGYPDLYITNGFISGPRKDNLSSFFWRQVVTRSLAGNGRSEAYQDAWNAINEFIRSDHSWSGYQRNNCYINNRNGSFTEAAGVLGLDFLDDSRAFALADFNHDGRLDVVLKNRTAPQIKVLENRLDSLGLSIAFALRGTKSNRDAIGAVIELQTPAGGQRKTVSAGSGFLMQHTKDVYFGLGEVRTPLRALIHWPSGAKQVFENLPPGHRIEIVEGSLAFKAAAFEPSKRLPEISRHEEALPEASGIWLVGPILAPDFVLPDGRRLQDFRGKPLVLLFCRSNCPQSQRQLQAVQAAWPEWQQAQLQVLSICAGDPPANDQVCGIYNIFHRYLFDRRRDMVLPAAFLMDRNLAVIKVYSGYTEGAQFVGDWRSVSPGAESGLRRALPFPGRYLGNPLHHNYFSYGVAYLRYGYPDQALLSFHQAIEKNPSYAAAYYNVGLIHLNRHELSEALTNLQAAIDLDPGNANVWNNLGVAHGQSGDYAQALQAFQKALALEPAHSLALQNLVKVYVAQGRSADARKLLESAILAQPDQMELRLALAMLLLQANELPPAQSEFEKALQLQPDNLDARNGLGVVLMRMGRTEDAIACFERCRVLAPDYPRAYLNLALIYTRKRDIRKAREVLQQFPLARHDSPEIKKALQDLEQDLERQP